MLCASNPGKDSCQGESGGDDDHEEKKDKRQRRGKYDGNNRYRYIDLQQVYLLQSEALKYLLSCLFANTFAITAVSSTDNTFANKTKQFGFSDFLLTESWYISLPTSSPTAWFG